MPLKFASPSDHARLRDTFGDVPRKVDPKRAGKFGAIPVSNENGKFDSKSEASTAARLLELQQLGTIENLKLDKRELKFAFDVDGVRVGEYTADASFDVLRDFEIETFDGPQILRAGQHHVCDVKSKATKRVRDWPLRRNLVYALYRIKLLELP